MQKSKIFSFKIDIYNTEVVVFYHCPIEQIQKYMNKNLSGVVYERNPSWRATSFVCIAKNGYEVYCIDFAAALKINSPSSHNTIVHESFHTLCKIFEPRGINLEYNEDEVFTYPLGFIVEKINEGLFKKEKNGRK